nr:putative mitochondrial protein [Tanacetum cinerariifolium]
MRSGIAYLLLYVDNIILTASSSAFLQWIITSLHSEFATTDLGSLNYFLGISTQRLASGLFLSQLKFEEEILERAHTQNCNPCWTPVDTESKLGSNVDLVNDPTLYRSLAGALHLRYVCGNLDYDLQLHVSSTTQLSTYTDVNWVERSVIRRSTSSAEAEYRGVANVVVDTSWIRYFLCELYTPLFTAILVYCYNVSAIYMFANPVQHQRTKHIEIDIHSIRDWPENNTDDRYLVGHERFPLGLRVGLSFYPLVYESVSSGIQLRYDLRDVEIERLRQRVRELEINPFDKYERQYEDTPTDTAVEEYENKEIPEFKRRLCPDDFLDWLRTVDRIFDLRDTPDHIKVKLVAIRLKNLLLYGGIMCKINGTGRVLTLIDEVDQLYDTEDEAETKVVYPDWGELPADCLTLLSLIKMTIPRGSELIFFVLNAQLRIRMRPVDEWKTAFKIRDGLYEWMVMPFGLSNAPRTGIRMDTTKISVITTWPPPTSLHDVRNFYGLASFYRRFIQGFSTIVSPITECLKSSKIVWNTTAQSIFEQLKHAVTEAPVLALPNFEHVCHVEYDASGLGIGGVLSQLRPITFFREKLNDTRRRYSTYDKDLYAIVRSHEYWRHYLLPTEFILYFDHQALKFIQGQAKLKPRHAKRVETLQKFSFVIRHKAGSAN